MNKEPILRDDQIPRHTKNQTSKEIVKRYGSVRFWTIANNVKYASLMELLRGRTNGACEGSDAQIIKRKLIDEGLWFEPLRRSKKSKKKLAAASEK